MKKYPFLLASLLLLTSCSSKEDPEETFTPSPVVPPSISQPQTVAPTQTVTEPEDDGISFTSTTASGEAISSAIFADYDLTVINVWATWCGPCVNEMPDLEELHQMLPDNINFISVCDDFSRNEATAKAILDASGATFQTIVANNEVTNSLLTGLLAFPTTLFVDREGNFVGTPLQGAPSGNVANVYYSRVMQVLESLDLPEVTEEETLPEEDVHEEEVMEDDVTEDDATEDDVTEDDVTEDDATEDDATEDDVTEDDATEDDATEDDATEDDATEDDATEEDPFVNYERENSFLPAPSN